MFPTLIAHELGHFIDIHNRPLEYTGGLTYKEEFFADNIGAKIVTNAGFEASTKSFAKFLKNLNNELMTKRGNNIEKQQSQIKQSKNYTDIIAGVTKFPQSKLTTPTTIPPIIM